MQHAARRAPDDESPPARACSWASVLFTSANARSRGTEPEARPAASGLPGGVREVAAGRDDCGNKDPKRAAFPTQAGSSRASKSALEHRADTVSLPGESPVAGRSPTDASRTDESCSHRPRSSHAEVLLLPAPNPHEGSPSWRSRPAFYEAIPGGHAQGRATCHAFTARNPNARCQ